MEVKVKERWKFLYGNKNYQISDSGTIRSLDRIISVYRNGGIYNVFREGRVLNNRNTKTNPHLFTSVASVNDKGECYPKTIYLLRAVADHFVTKSNEILLAEIEGRIVCATPKDGNHNNVSYKNVKWITLSDVIRKQPKRLLDPTKSWRTRRQLYGRSGQLSKTI